MDEFKTVLGAVVPIFGIAGVGLLIRKLNWLTEEADQSLLRVNINLLLPCLILDSAIGNPALGQWRNLLHAPAVGFGTVALGMALAFAARPLHGLTDRRSARTFGVSVGIYNYGYVPLPLTLLLFDKQTAGVLFLVMVGVETALWTLGVIQRVFPGTWPVGRRAGGAGTDAQPQGHAEALSTDHRQGVRGDDTRHLARDLGFIPVVPAFRQTRRHLQGVLVLRTGRRRTASV